MEKILILTDDFVPYSNAKYFFLISLGLIIVSGGSYSLFYAPWGKERGRNRWNEGS